MTDRLGSMRPGGVQSANVVKDKGKEKVGESSAGVQQVESDRSRVGLDVPPNRPPPPRPSGRQPDAGGSGAGHQGATGGTAKPLPTPPRQAVGTDHYGASGSSSTGEPRPRTDSHAAGQAGGRSVRTSQLGSDQYLDRHGDVRQRSVGPLSYGSAQLQEDVGKPSTLGSIRGKLASLPFVGKTTYGRVLDKLKAYEGGPMRAMSPDQKKGQLEPLRQEIKAWLDDPKHQVRTNGFNSPKEMAMTQLLTAVERAIDEAHFDETKPAQASRREAVTQLKDELAEQTGVGKVTANSVLRAEVGAAKTIAAHLRERTPASYRSDLAGEAVRTARTVAPEMSILKEDGLGKLAPKPMSAVLTGASQLLGGFIGLGRQDPTGAAAALPQELVNTLKEVDAAVAKATGGDDQARYNAFVRTLFQRHVLPEMAAGVRAQPDRGAGVMGNDRERNAIGHVTAAIEHAVMQTPETGWTAKVPQESHDEFRDFVAEHRQPMQDFMQAVLER